MYCVFIFLDFTRDHNKKVFQEGQLELHVWLKWTDLQEIFPIMFMWQAVAVYL